MINEQAPYAEERREMWLKALETKVSKLTLSLLFFLLLLV